MIPKMILKNIPLQVSTPATTQQPPKKNCLLTYDYFFKAYIFLCLVFHPLKL